MFSLGRRFKYTSTTELFVGVHFLASRPINFKFLINRGVLDGR